MASCEGGGDSCCVVWIRYNIPCTTDVEATAISTAAAKYRLDLAWTFFDGWWRKQAATALAMVKHKMVLRGVR